MKAFVATRPVPRIRFVMKIQNVCLRILGPSTTQSNEMK